MDVWVSREGRKNNDVRSFIPTHRSQLFNPQSCEKHHICLKNLSFVSKTRIYKIRKKKGLPEGSIFSK
jgi:hypothetical protein